MQDPLRTYNDWEYDRYEGGILLTDKGGTYTIKRGSSNSEVFNVPGTRVYYILDVDPYLPFVGIDMVDLAAEDYHGYGTEQRPIEPDVGGGWQEWEVDEYFGEGFLDKPSINIAKVLTEYIH